MLKEKQNATRWGITEPPLENTSKIFPRARAFKPFLFVEPFKIVSRHFPHLGQFSEKLNS